jgi:two-component system, OmpR family, sensor histidine kinase SenX3
MTRRQKAIAVIITFCVLLVAAAISLNISWIVITARRDTVLVVAGVLLFGLIIAGLIVYTVFLVAAIRRNEEHDSFINAVTHELKTPIASIRLYLETLQSRPVSEEQRQQFYDIMLADAQRLHQTVDQVLRAGVVRERPRGAARTSVVDMAALARECVDLALTRHHLPPGAIQLEAHEGGHTVRGDSEELRTVIGNLLDNAVKYSGQDVRVTVAVASPAPDTVWVRVQDRGIGIPKKQLKRIFNRFYRVQTRTLKQVKGTGLGLYIVRAIARAHGGRVFAQSEGEGRGATFTLELPRLAR